MLIDSFKLEKSDSSTTAGIAGGLGALAGLILIGLVVWYIWYKKQHRMTFVLSSKKAKTTHLAPPPPRPRFSAAWEDDKPDEIILVRTRSTSQPIDDGRKAAWGRNPGQLIFTESDKL